jgi:beta-lactamase regulating signal transducer with metallopeptidase domain
MPGSAAAGMPGLMAGYLLRTSVVLTLALLAAAAARRRPAALRHFILSSGLIGLLLLPFLSLAPLSWRSPLVPGWMAPAEEHAGGPAARLLPYDPEPSRGPELSGAARARIEAPNKEGLRLGDMSENGARRTGEPAATSLTAGRAAVSSAPAPEPRAAARNTGGAFGFAMAFLWSAGVAALVLRLAAGLSGALRLTAEGRPLAGALWHDLIERFLAHVPFRRRVRLKSHPEVLVPLTWGWRRPVILLPSGAEAWSAEERSSALFHELSHIKRADFAVMLLVRSSLAVFWWNPLCWVAYRELLKEQELACDELVLRAGIRPSSYAASLIAFRRSAGFRWNPSAALLGMLGRASFQDRLAAILRQKITMMEVKMKTKIMLALMLVMAVALVGTARPVSGPEPEEARMVLAGTAVVAQTQTEPAAAQEKEQEKAKAAEKAQEAEKAVKKDAAAAKTIVIRPAVAEGKPIEVTISEGDAVKTLVFDQPLTITGGKDGGAIVLTVDGKEVQVLEGKPLRLEIKGGEIKIAKEAGLVIAGEGGTFKIVKEGGGEGKTIVFYGTADPKVVVEVEPEVLVKLRKDQKEGEPATAWTVTEGGKEGVWVAKTYPGKSGSATWVGRGGQAFAFSTGMRNEKMLEEVRALQEQVQAIKAKKMDITALEESLKKLEAELRANEEKLRELKVKVDKAPHGFTVYKKARADEAEGKTAVWVVEKDKAAKADEATVVMKDDGDGTVNVILTGKTGDEGRKAYERALARLKKDLPEGFTLVGQSFDPDNGTTIFAISAGEGRSFDKASVRKLVEALQAEIKK